MGLKLPDSIELPKTGLAEALGQGLSQGLQTSLMAKLQQKLLAAQPITPYQQIQTSLRAKELGQKEEKEKERTSEWQYEQHKDFRKELNENYKSTLESEMRLNRMAELNDSGQLTNQYAALALDKFGLPISVLNNPDSEEFDKLSKDLLKNVRSYFGSRINIVEVENFLKTIPTLLNSQEGRRRIINNLKMLQEPKKLMFDAYRQIKKEAEQTGKTLPVDLEEKVLERIKPQLDTLSKKFEVGDTQISTEPSIPNEDMINVYSPEGKPGKVKRSQLKEALKKGYKKR